MKFYFIWVLSHAEKQKNLKINPRAKKANYFFFFKYLTEKVDKIVDTFKNKTLNTR